jgi:proteic killer suppression protein
LQQLFEEGSAKGINPDHGRKLGQILAVLNATRAIEGMNVPTFRPHPLKGDLKGLWAVTVRANWRVVFRCDDGDAFDVDLVDYH